jgi:hypothetical protein
MPTTAPVAMPTAQSGQRDQISISALVVSRCR